MKKRKEGVWCEYSCPRIVMKCHPSLPEKKGKFEIKSEGGKPSVYPDKTILGMRNLQGKDISIVCLGCYRDSGDA